MSERRPVIVALAAALLAVGYAVGSSGDRSDAPARAQRPAPLSVRTVRVPAPEAGATLAPLVTPAPPVPHESGPPEAPASAGGTTAAPVTVAPETPAPEGPDPEAPAPDAPAPPEPEPPEPAPQSDSSPPTIVSSG